MVGGGQCSSVIVVILTLLGDDRGAPSGWRIIHSNNNNVAWIECNWLHRWGAVKAYRLHYYKYLLIMQAPPLLGRAFCHTMKLFWLLIIVIGKSEIFLGKLFKVFNKINKIIF